MESTTVKKQCGISLLEVMLSLVIISVVLTMAVRYFGIVSGDSQFNQTISVVDEIKQGLAKYALFSGQDPLKATLKDLRDGDYISKQIDKIDAWGGELKLEKGTVTLSKVPTLYCTRLANAFPSASCSSNNTVTINNILQ